jgi:hypothetical protein
MSDEQNAKLRRRIEEQIAELRAQAEALHRALVLQRPPSRIN